MTNLRVRYQTIEFGKIDIHLCTLRNRQEFHDPEGVAEKLGISSAAWPIFGVVWPSSIVLAHHMSGYATSAKRILEVGCGMALSSLLLNKLKADITATDHHPEAAHFLERNARLNDDKPIEFIRADWSGHCKSLGRFDLIIGSDLLYEDQSIELLAGFINEHANRECEVIIVDPGRGRKNKLSVVMKRMGYTSTEIMPKSTEYLTGEFKGHILTYRRYA